ncbi:GGDEF domain-containing protein [Thalassotalea sp. ND16A]|uniref:GGDEF domain-containing protein n=1 Tax=Thalassotalea sp. ND16A TaxID=1535422 RepID=UPI00051A7052|nr:GGDEF domain-containing protein [Thalassotalea sp. ND16A]KGJ93297.1 hypothetical protein ND16A_1558 [Thalassotalea sp. ND16A]
MTKNSTKLFDHYFNTLIAEGFHRTKALQLFTASQLALLIAAAVQFFNEAYYQGGSLVVVLLIIGVGFMVLNKTKPKAAIALLLFSHTCLATVLMWMYGGIRDEVLFVYPLILIFAALLGSTKIMSFLFAFISLAIFANGLVNHYDFYLNSVQQISLQSAALVNLLLLVIFVGSYFAIESIKELITKLITENDAVERSKNEIQKLLHQDALTGLPNRMVAEEKLSLLVAQARSENSKTALLFVDLDDFKNINNTLGHQMGDKFLKILSTRIAGTVAEFGSTYRLGGDEFIILLEKVNSTEQVKQLSEKIATVVSQPLIINDHHLSTCCSIGITICPDNTQDFDTALKYADIALHQAKSAGRNQICLIDEQMIAKTEAEFTILEELRKALLDKSFKVHFQPKYDLRNNRIIGAEALLRWWHPTMGQITPNQFIRELTAG